MIGWCFSQAGYYRVAQPKKGKLNMYIRSKQKKVVLWWRQPLPHIHSTHSSFFFLLCLFLYLFMVCIRCATLRSSSSNTLNRCVNTRLSKQLGTEPRAAASVCVQRRSINYMCTAESRSIESSKQRGKNAPQMQKPPIQVWTGKQPLSIYNRLSAVLLLASQRTSFSTPVWMWWTPPFSFGYIAPQRPI